jgi:hypothetical protein
LPTEIPYLFRNLIQKGKEYLSFWQLHKEDKLFPPASFNMVHDTANMDPWRDNEFSAVHSMNKETRKKFKCPPCNVRLLALVSSSTQQHCISEDYPTPHYNGLHKHVTILMSLYWYFLNNQILIKQWG